MPGEQLLKVMWEGSTTDHLLLFVVVCFLLMSLFCAVNVTKKRERDSHTTHRSSAAVKKLKSSMSQPLSVEKISTENSPGKKTRRRRKESTTAKATESVVRESVTKIISSVGPETKSDRSLADITRKKCTGSNNWSVFLTGLGKKEEIKPKSSVTKSPQAPKGNVNKPPKLTKCVALDCEFVGIGHDGRENMLGRVSVVNSLGECLYDTFVKAREEVTDYRTYVSGVRPSDMVQGEDFEKVQEKVASLLKGRILIGHSIRNDMTVLKLSHPKHSIRDTSIFFREKGRSPSLKQLAAEFLGTTIQEGEHSSIQDAHATMLLYNMFKKEWEAGGGNKKSNRFNRSMLLNKSNKQ